MTLPVQKLFCAKHCLKILQYFKPYDTFHRHINQPFHIPRREEWKQKYDATFYKAIAIFIHFTASVSAVQPCSHSDATLILKTKQVPTTKNSCIRGARIILCSRTELRKVILK